MAYIAAAIEPVSTSCIAIYKVGTQFEARQVHAFAIFRNVEDRSAENILCPLHSDDFIATQELRYPKRSDIVARLPYTLIDSLRLLDAMGEQEFVEVSLSATNGMWEVI